MKPVLFYSPSDETGAVLWIHEKSVLYREHRGKPVLFPQLPPRLHPRGRGTFLPCRADRLEVIVRGVPTCRAALQSSWRSSLITATNKLWGTELMYGNITEMVYYQILWIISTFEFIDQTNFLLKYVESAALLHTDTCHVEVATPPTAQGPQRLIRLKVLYIIKGHTFFCLTWCPNWRRIHLS